MLCKSIEEINESDNMLLVKTHSAKKHYRYMKILTIQYVKQFKRLEGSLSSLASYVKISGQFTTKHVEDWLHLVGIVFLRKGSVHLTCVFSCDFGHYF